jgi:hypothetical protein
MPPASLWQGMMTLIPSFAKRALTRAVFHNPQPNPNGKGTIGEQ